MQNAAKTASLVEQAPAKINLYLHITGRRDDGYHLIDSLFAFTALGDRLTLVPDDDVILEVSGPFADKLAGEQDNLILAAARALRPMRDRRRQDGRPSGVRIRLEKNIPVAAGLGGGSADAAAALRALVKFWDIDIGRATLEAIALELGADVPACFASLPAFVSGIGEAVRPISDLPQWPVVLVNPGVAMPTGKVFGEFRRSGAFRAPATVAGPVDFLALIGESENNLEPCACALEPVIGEVLGALQRQQGCFCARMSGSGATCFAVFESHPTAAAAAAELKRLHSEWWCVATRLIQANEPLEST